MKVYKGPFTTVKKVALFRLKEVLADIIQSLITIRSKKPFSRLKLIDVQRKLAASGYFNPEEVLPVPIPNPENNTVDIEFQLEEL